MEMRGLRLLAYGALAVAGGFFGSCFQEANILRSAAAAGYSEFVATRTLVLVDQHGIPRGRLSGGTDENDGPSLIFSDRRGKARLQISFDDRAGTGLFFFDQGGEPRVHMELGNDGGASLGLDWAKGKPGVVMGLSPAEGLAAVVASGSSGHESASINASVKGDAAIVLLDSLGRLRSELSVLPPDYDNSPVIRLYDSAGGIRTSLVAGGLSLSVGGSEADLDTWSKGPRLSLRKGTSEVGHLP